ncbi:hypothetical protein KUTeg_014779 [Tegillarca granosa]|uniref:ZMYM2-like/QRICH1 C-terminal domain-containing protein n=1 Tax=Tegillarca granosa TaxID=220873 RepID=A0ABQ9ER18_TEGGR|nr:hypothetical protein KUTeg_014779 [Tegillarca granosa]
MDVLVEDIFRYERLAEQSGELESVQEVECPKDILGIINRNDSATLISVPGVDVYKSDVEFNIKNATTDNTNISTDYSGRFVHFTEGDAEEFMAKNVNKNTKYKTSSDIKLFKEFLNELREVREPETIPPKELDNYIARFYFECQTKSFNETKKEYEPDTLTSTHNSIDRYLKEKKVEFSIKHDSVFSHSNNCLQEKRKYLKSMDLGSKDRAAEPLSKEELKILNENNILGAGNPQSHLDTVWLNNGVLFGLQSRQDHVNLRWGDIKLKQTSDGKEYLEFFERQTKHVLVGRGGIPGQLHQKLLQYQGMTTVQLVCLNSKNNTDHQICSQIHREQHNCDFYCVQQSSKFYLRPLDNPKSQIWYSHQPLGKDKLGQKMKDLANKGNLQGRKVNHSARKTFASTLFHSKVPPTEVAQLEGWKNVGSVNSYSVPSMEQQEIASNILSDVVAPNERVAVFSDTGICHNNQCIETISFDYVDKNVESSVKMD